MNEVDILMHIIMWSCDELKYVSAFGHSWIVWHLVE